jgi:UDP-GalNAc:undecaprenyl-phosphate GalNAc-1-phosphate transferase
MVDDNEMYSQKRNYVHFKTLWECGLILILLPVWVPICLLVAVCVALESPGPIFYVQNRIGQNGRVFQMFKFRSMLSDKRSELMYAAKDDNRITRVGRYIRKFRLDELPQLIHVLTGEMALVGVRPEPQLFAEKYSKMNPVYDYRHVFKPGLTGWSQVEYGYASSGDETMRKLEYDLYYVRNISFKLDMLILWKTVLVVFSGFGAR